MVNQATNNAWRKAETTNTVKKINEIKKYNDMWNEQKHSLAAIAEQFKASTFVQQFRISIHLIII